MSLPSEAPLESKIKWTANMINANNIYFGAVPNVIFFTTDIVGHKTSSKRIDWHFMITLIWPGDTYELCITEKRYSWIRVGYKPNSDVWNTRTGWQIAKNEKRNPPIIKYYKTIEEAKEATISFIKWHQNNSTIKDRLVNHAKKILGIDTDEYSYKYHFNPQAWNCE